MAERAWSLSRGELRGHSRLRSLQGCRPSYMVATRVSLSVLAALSLGLPPLAGATFRGRNGQLAVEALWCDPSCDSGAPGVGASLLALTPTSTRARLIDADVDPEGVAYSADGRWLAYVNGGGISIRSTRASSRAIAFAHRGRGPLWAPKGENLVFARGSNPASLYLAGPATRPRAIGEVRSGGEAPSYVWSPTGSELATVRRGHVFTLNPRTGASHSLGAGNQPAWSTDGRRIAVVRRGAIVILDRKANAVTGPPGNSSVWLSDDTLLFESATTSECSDDPCNDIDLFDTRTGLVRTVGVGGGISAAPGYKFAIFSHPRNDLSTRFTIVDASGGHRRDLTIHLYGAPTPVWSPDGTRLAAATRRGIQLFDSNGRLRRTLRYQIPPALAKMGLDFSGDAVVDWQALP
jgi:dipeptidyl aminopeptidase/acylaminoacyl peptidase